MRSKSARVLLFGDGTVDPVPCLRQLARDSKQIASLDAFLRITASALRSEIARSPSPSRETYPRFSTIIGLTEWYAALPVPEITVFPVLLCVAQLGVLLSEHELNPSILEASTASPLYSIGLCNGMLAAAAVSSCKSTADILALGPELVCVNLRMMLALVDRSSAIDDSPGAWTILTPAMKADEHYKLIESFTGGENQIPVACRPYVSAQSDAASTISGPPPILSKYFDSAEELRKTKKIPTTINTACHASHLWSPDLHQIVGDKSLWESYTIREHVMSLSIHTGEVIEASSLSSLLIFCVNEVLNRRFRWDVVLKSLCENVKRTCAEAAVFAVGPDRVCASVRSALANSGVQASIAEPSTPSEASALPTADDIAIVGVSSRLPGANTLEEVWQLLRDGKDMHGNIPPDRFDLSDHLDSTGRRPNTVSVPFGCFLEKPGAFDARMFNMSPREANQTDPMQRLALLTTYEALEMAGYSPNALPSFTSERIATFWGQTVDDYRETNASQNVDIYYVSGGVRAFAPGRLNYHFKWEGPSMSVDTACSSSALAVQLAFQSLRSGECDMAVAGGANIITGPDMYAGLCRGGFLSKTGQCKTFDDTADGYCRGEGVGSVILKRLKDAQADGDNVLAVIKSCSTNHSAFAESITRPESGAQIKVMRRILEDANLSPEDIDYIEMHGTGTQAGDATEFSSVSEVFAKGRNKRHPLYVGSIKSNVGHGEAAAGINSLVKIILMLRHDAIPPCIGIRDKINSKFSKPDLEIIAINRELQSFRRLASRPRRIVLNSFNAAGGNTAIVVEDPPKYVSKDRSKNGQGISDPRSSHVVVVSGHTRKSFDANRENLWRFVKQNRSCRIADVAYTTTARRMHHGMRRSYVAEDVSQLVQALSQDLKTNKAPVESKKDRKVVFNFTGQGSHTLDMARKLVGTCTPFSDKLQQYESICQNQGLPSFLDLVRQESPPPFPVAAFQVSIAAIQMALVASLKAWGITPDAVIGHSIGEYAALASAGVLSEAEALYLAGKRAMVIEELCKPGRSSMLAVTAKLDQVEGFLSDLHLDDCAIACHNGPSSFVVSGPVDNLVRLSERLTKSNIRNRAVEVDFGFHSAQMEVVGDRICKFAAGVSFHSPKIPIASTLLGKVIETAGVFDHEYLAAQTTDPVLFSQALQALSKSLRKPAESVWVEIGTDPMFGSMIASTVGVPVSQTSYMLRRNEDPWQSISRSLAKAFELGVNVEWSEYHKHHSKNLSLTELPYYSFDIKNHWIPYANSWRLDKGQGKKEVEPAVPKPDPRLAPFHYLQHEDIGKTVAKAQLICDISDPKIASMISGHLVIGVGLCPSSVYAHLAFNVATYIMQKATSSSQGSSALALENMNIISPLKTTSSQASPSDLSVSAEWSIMDPGVVQVAFSTTTDTEERMHCRCTVSSGKVSQWQNDWREHEYLIQSQLDFLKNSEKRCVDTLSRSMLFRLIASSIVEYSKEYQLIERISIDYQRNEAVADLKMSDKIETKNGSPGPFPLDVVMHMAGFVLNSSPHFKSDDKFIASGWTSLKLAEPLRAGASYVCYTRMMMEADSNVFCGNVSILSDGKIIGTCRGLKFHRLRHKSLQVLLGAPQEASRPPVPVKPKISEMKTSTKQNRTPKPAPTQDVSSIKQKDPLSEILEDIAAETSTAVSDLQDDTRLSELGIDSLLTISLLNRFKDRTGTDLPVNTFSVCATISALKEYLREKLDLKDSPSSTETEVEAQEAACSGSAETNSDAVAPRKATMNGSSKFQVLCNIITSEVGVEAGDIMAASTISELGIDSILTISIGNEYKARTGEELSPRFFYDYPTISSIVEHLDGSSPATTNDSAPSSEETSVTTMDDDFEPSETTSAATPDTALTPELPSPSAYSCVSMLLQGDTSSGQPALFMLPDGSGSLFSYIHMPKSKPNMPVYAIDSPFHKNPEDYNISFAMVAEIYVREIRRLQPCGPYMIGGWSLGGVHAFEVARQLLEAGEEVRRLVMIDSPCPGTLPPLPHASLDLLEKAGIFKGLSKEVGDVAQHTRTHFVRVTDSFQHWDYRPLNDDELSRLGTVTAIWAQYGVLEDDEDAKNAWVPGMDKVDADMLKAKEWLTGKRTSFTAEGWDKLVRKEVDCYTVPGNHFSIMFPPVVSHVAKVLKKVL